MYVLLDGMTYQYYFGRGKHRYVNSAWYYFNTEFLTVYQSLIWPHLKWTFPSEIKKIQLSAPSLFPLNCSIQSNHIFFFFFSYFSIRSTYSLQRKSDKDATPLSPSLFHSYVGEMDVYRFSYICTYLGMKNGDIFICIALISMILADTFSATLFVRNR